MGVAQQIHHTLPPHLESASKSGEQNRVKEALLGGLLTIQLQAESGSDLMGCPVVGRDRCNMRTSLAIGIADVNLGGPRLASQMSYQIVRGGGSERRTRVRLASNERLDDGSSYHARSPT